MHAFILATLFTALAPAQAQQKLPTVTLNAGIHLIQAEVALNDADRAQGLMFREKMGPNEGMVFRFNSTNQVCMWMKNTLLPLTAAFVADDGTIVNLVDMEPQTLNSHCSIKPVRFVLEMNQGWFAKKGIKAGAKLTGTPFKN